MEYKVTEIKVSLEEHKIKVKKAEERIQVNINDPIWRTERENDGRKISRILWRKAWLEKKNIDYKIMAKKVTYIMKNTNL